MNKFKEKHFSTLYLVISFFSFAYSAPSLRHAESSSYSAIFQIPEINNRLNDAAYIPGTDDVIVVGSNIILKSSDGGKKWSKVYGGTDSLEYDHVLSSDLGLTEIKHDGYKQQPVFTTIHIDDTQSRILVAGGFYKKSDLAFNHYILSSDDSGKTWNQLLFAPSPDTIKHSSYPSLYVPGIINDITVDDSGTIWAVDNGLLLKSTDSGKSWNFYLFPNSGLDVTSLCTSIAFINNNGWIAAGIVNNTVPPGGISGIYYGSTDGGSSWKTINLVSPFGKEYLIHNKLIINNKGDGYIGWMVGGIMLASPSEIQCDLVQLKRLGATEYAWEAYAFSYDNTQSHFFIDIDMNSKGIGCSLCPNGDFYLTNNWGKSWGNRKSPELNNNKNVFFNTVALSDKGFGLLAGSNGYVAIIDKYLAISDKPRQNLPILHGNQNNGLKNMQLNGKIIRSPNLSSQCIIAKRNNFIFRKYLSFNK